MNVKVLYLCTRRYVGKNLKPRTKSHTYLYNFNYQTNNLSQCNNNKNMTSLGFSYIRIEIQDDELTIVLVRTTENVQFVQSSIRSRTPMSGFH